MDIVRTFIALKPRLFGIAYRILGSRSDAEDVIQETWLRWYEADRAELRSTEAWLVTVTTHLSIDRLRACRNTPEVCVDWSFSEPSDERRDRCPAEAAEFANDLSTAVLWMLDCLSPEERSVFLPRKAFDMDYREIASDLGKSEVACRKIVSRASMHVRETEPRYDVSKSEHRDLLTCIVHAASTGDPAAIQKVIITKTEPIIGNPHTLLSFTLVRRSPSANNLVVGPARRATAGNVSVSNDPRKVWPPPVCGRRVLAVHSRQI